MILRRESPDHSGVGTRYVNSEVVERMKTVVPERNADAKELNSLHANLSESRRSTLGKSSRFRTDQWALNQII